MSVLAYMIAWPALVLAIAAFFISLMQAILGNGAAASKGETTAVAYLIVAGLFFLVAKGGA